MSVLISTTETIPGYKIVAYKGLVWASTARSRHIGSDLFAVGKSLVGGEINPYKKLMNEGRNDVVQGLVRNAESIGANAVIGVRFGSTQIVPAMLDLVAYGTAVVVHPEHGHRDAFAVEQTLHPSAHHEAPRHAAPHHAAPHKAQKHKRK